MSLWFLNQQINKFLLWQKLVGLMLLRYIRDTQTEWERNKKLFSHVCQIRSCNHRVLSWWPFISSRICTGSCKERVNCCKYGASSCLLSIYHSQKPWPYFLIYTAVLTNFFLHSFFIHSLHAVFHQLLLLLDSTYSLVKAEGKPSSYNEREDAWLVLFK